MLGVLHSVKACFFPVCHAVVSLTCVESGSLCAIIWPTALQLSGAVEEVVGVSGLNLLQDLLQTFRGFCPNEHKSFTENCFFKVGSHSEGKGVFWGHLTLYPWG